MNARDSRRTEMKKLTTWLLLLSTYFTFIAPATTANAQIMGKAMDQKLKDVPNGLKFRLSEGVEGAETRVKQQLPSTDPLSETDANGLLKRIPEIKPAADDKTDFAKRIGSLPAPKTGNKITAFREKFKPYRFLFSWRNSFILFAINKNTVLINKSRILVKHSGRISPDKIRATY